jgi:hypothetical protein
MTPKEVKSMMHGKEMEESEMEGMKSWWEHISEDKKKAFIKAKLDFKIKKVQARLDFLERASENFRMNSAIDSSKCRGASRHSFWKEINCEKSRSNLNF